MLSKLVVGGSNKVVLIRNKEKRGGGDGEGSSATVKTAVPPESRTQRDAREAAREARDARENRAVRQKVLEESRGTYPEEVSFSWSTGAGESHSEAATRVEAQVNDRARSTVQSLADKHELNHMDVYMELLPAGLRSRVMSTRYQ